MIKSMKFSGKIIVIMVLVMMGFFLLRSVAPTTQATSGGTMQGAGAAITPQPAIKTGMCAKIAAVDKGISILTLSGGLTVDAIGNIMMGAILFPVINGVCSLYSSSIQFLENQDFVFGTSKDYTYGHPMVIGLWGTMQTIAGMVLAVMWMLVGFNVMRGESVADSVPRLVLATVLAFGAFPILSGIINLESAMCQMILTASGLLPSGVSVASAGLDLVSLFAGVGSFANLVDLATTLPSLLVLIEAIAVGFEMVVRVALLDLLLICSPVLILYGLPQWQKWANMWVVAFMSVVFVQFLQVVAICLGASLTKYFGGSGGIISLFTGIAMLYLVLKIPSWFGGIVSSGLTGVSTPYDVAGKAAGAAFGAARTAIAAIV